MKKLIQVIAGALVEEADKLTVVAKKGNKSTIYTMLAAEGDAGKIIGRKGRNIKAIRQVVRAVATHRGERVDLEVSTYGEAATVHHSQNRGDSGE